MKNHYFLLLFLLINSFLFSQNYRLLNKNLTNHYHVSYTSDNAVFTAKVDSAVYDGVDSIYYLNKYVSAFNSCLTNNSLFSDKIFIKTDGTQLLIKSGDTVTIKNPSAINDVWKLFTFPYDNSYLEAKYVSNTLTSFLGVSDSVKNYKISRYNASGVLMTTNSFSADTLKISKQHGIIQGYEFLALYTYPYHYVSTLVGINQLNEEYRPKSYAEIFNFEIGTVFHRHIIDEYRDEYMGNYSYSYSVTSNQNDSIHLKVLDKQENGTTITYTFLREINQVLDTVKTIINVNEPENESGSILKNFTLDSLMNFFSFDAKSTNKKIPVNTFGLNYTQYYAGSENNSISADTTCFNDDFVSDFPFTYYTELGKNLGVINFNTIKYEEYYAWDYTQYYTTIYQDVLVYSDNGVQKRGVPLFNKISSNKINSCDGEVTFYANYRNAISYLWDFGDGTTATDMNPTHIYTAESDYSVRLTMVTHFGTYTLNLANQINVGDYTIANFPSFSTSLDETCNTFIVTDLSNSSGTRLWDFGGIGTGTGQTETFTFVPGNNNYIKLTIIDQFCTFEKTVLVDIDTTNTPMMASCPAYALEGIVQNLFELKINNNALATTGRKYPANYFVNACKLIELDTLSFELLSAIGSEYSYYEPGIGDIWFYDQSDYSFWLDLNDNGEFSSDENIFIMPAYSDGYVFTNTNQIDIPNSVIRNKNLRLRLVVYSLTDPCAGNRYDFSMKITAPIQDASLNETDLYGNKLYPNPNKGTFTYQIANPNKINSIAILNELGQELYATEQITTQTTITLKNVSSGLYFLKTKGEKGEEIIKFMIE